MDNELKNIGNNKKEILDELSKDKEYDQESIFWDGKQAFIIKDLLDSKNIRDGRSGPFPSVRLKSNVVKTIFCVQTDLNKELLETNESLLEDSENLLILESYNRYLKLEKFKDITFEEEIKKIISKYIELKDIVTNNSTYYKVFAGIFHTNNSMEMMGIKVIYEHSNMLYSLSYAGIGNFSDIKVEAYMIAGKLLS